MPSYTLERLREILREKVPQDNIVPQHTDTEHYYEVKSLSRVMPSVSWAIKLLKDEGLMNWKMNESCRYIEEHLHDLTSLKGVIAEAKRQPQRIFEDAGDIGSRIHAYREKFFSDWITNGWRPTRAESYVPSDEYDIRAISALAALEKFIDDYEYIPVATELRVWSEKYGLAGTLDDLGMIGGEFGSLILLDIKTSNQIKDSYWMQICWYRLMLKELTGIVPKKVFILRLSKEDRLYQIEELKDMREITWGCKALYRLNNSLDKIKINRKDNQKNVIKI